MVGDDLLVTNPSRVKTAIEKKACNALLLKASHPYSCSRHLLYLLPVLQLLYALWAREFLDTCAQLLSASCLQNEFTDQSNGSIAFHANWTCAFAMTLLLLAALA